MHVILNIENGLILLALSLSGIPHMFCRTKTIKAMHKSCFELTTIYYANQNCLEKRMA